MRPKTIRSEIDHPTPDVELLGGEREAEAKRVAMQQRTVAVRRPLPNGAAQTRARHRRSLPSSVFYATLLGVLRRSERAK